MCYTEFYEQYLVKNQLCLLSGPFTDSWPCRELWVRDGKPNWEYLLEIYGSFEIQHFFLDFMFSYYIKNCLLQEQQKSL